MKPVCTCLSHKEGLILSNGSEKIKKKRPYIAKRTISSKKMLYAIFFNSSGPVVQVPCPSGHTVTGRFYKNSVLKKVKEFYNKKRPSNGWSGVHIYMRVLGPGSTHLVTAANLWPRYDHIESCVAVH